VRSKKFTKHATEQKASTRRKKSSHNSVSEVANEVRKNNKTRPHDFPTAEGLALPDDAQRSKVKSNKNTNSSIKSTIREED
jgi:hypothetical protein